MPAINVAQRTFRYRNNDGTETGATWVYAANTDGTLEVDTDYRMRFELTESSGVFEAGVNYRLQYNLNGDGWNDVTASSSVVKGAAFTGGPTDGDNCTQLIGSGGFQATNKGMTDGDGLQTNQATKWKNKSIEVEFVFTIVSGDVVDADSIQLRIVREPNTVLEGYTNTPSIEVNEAGGNNPISGTIAATATFSGNLVAKGALAGTIAAAAVFSGPLVGVGAVSGTLAAVTTFQAAGRAVGFVSGTIAATSTFSGPLIGTGALSGTLATAATFSGPLVGKGAIAGTVVVSTTFSGPLIGRGALAGTSPATATFTGSMIDVGVKTGQGWLGQDRGWFG